MKEPAGKTPSGKSKAVQVDMTSPWQKYANVVLIPIIIGLTIFLLVRFRMNAAADEKTAEMSQLTDIRQKLTDLRTRDLTRGTVDQVANLRDANYVEVGKAIDLLLDSSKDPTIRAEANVAEGDLNWAIANFPALPGATTRPNLAPPKSTDDLLTAAEASYSEVLKSYAGETNAAIAARLGLAAISEDRKNWDEAAKGYQTIVDDKTTPAAYSIIAQQRLDSIKTIRDALYFAPPPTLPAPGSELLSTTRPTTLPLSPMTMPATMPTVAPTTMPATLPAK